MWHTIVDNVFTFGHMNSSKVIVDENMSSRIPMRCRDVGLEANTKAIVIVE